MSYKNIVISSGHGSLVRGASGYLDEVDEARKIVDAVAQKLRARDVIAETFHDDTSTTQNQNLETIVRFHNSKSRQLDISVHLNAYITTSSPMGTECLYKSQSTLSAQMSAAMADAGAFIDRGPKKRTDLYFLNQTQMPAILLEICFVDSSADADLYNEHFEAIADAITKVIHPEGDEAQELVHPPLFTATGKCSYFGGPNDTGVAADEGLAFIYKIEDKPEVFLPYQPEGTSGLARRLEPLRGLRGLPLGLYGDAGRTTAHQTRAHPRRKRARNPRLPRRLGPAQLDGPSRRPLTRGLRRTQPQNRRRSRSHLPRTMTITAITISPLPRPGRSRPHRPLLLPTTMNARPSHPAQSPESVTPIPTSKPGSYTVTHQAGEIINLPEATEDDIVIKGEYTASNGMKIPINLITNKSGIIYQLYQQEAARRAGIKPLDDGNVSHLLAEGPPTPRLER